MEFMEQLELVDVQVEEGKKAVMTFMNKDQGTIHEVNFNKQSYDQNKNKFVDDAEKAEKVDQWCKDYFDLTFENLHKAVGQKHDIYAYDKFNSLFEVEMVEKFDKDMEGQIFETVVDEVKDNGNMIKILFEYDGNKYESKMNYSKYMEDMNQWFVDPVKQKKMYKKFEDKFHIKVDDMKELEGQKIMVEVKVAFGKFPYAEIKPFPKKKK